MKWSSVLGILVGLAIIGGLAADNDAAAIGRAVASAGWGILAVIALHLPQMVFSSQSWRRLLAARPSRPTSLDFVGLRLIREGVNALLPVAQIGGEFVGARLLALKGTPLSAASASVAVDLTLEMLSQILFTLLGLGLLMTGPMDARVGQWLGVGLPVALAVLALFVVAQRYGLFRLVEQALLWLARHQQWQGLTDIAGLHREIVALYRSPRCLAVATANHFISWLLGGAEVLAGLWALGVPVGWREAVIIESLGQAFRSLGFAVPGALGVQEGGFVLVCGLFQIPPQEAIALSLLKRVRELALGFPGLIAWQWMEKRERAGQAETSRSPEDSAENAS